MAKTLKRGRPGRACGMVRDERGAAMVEFALVISLMLTLLLGIFQFGSLLFAYSNILNAVRDGARHIAVGEWTPDDADGKYDVTQTAFTACSGASGASANVCSRLVGWVDNASVRSIAPGGSGATEVLVEVRTSASDMSVVSFIPFSTTLTISARMRQE